MKDRLILMLAILAAIAACKTIKKEPKKIENNQELVKMVEKDQQIRMQDIEDLGPIDKQHRIRLMEMIANGDIQTNKDKLNAALILQHTGALFCNDKLMSMSNENYLLAYMFSKSAFEAGDIAAAYYVAITYDRYLLYTEGYQKYGTQRVIDENEQEVWAPIDSTTTDEERAKYNVPKLDSLLKKYKMKQFLKSE